MIKHKSMAIVFAMQADEERRLLRDLLSIIPSNPQLSCKIWQFSNVDIREKVIGKFVTSQSIQSASLGSWSDEKSLLANTEALEDRTASYYLREKNRPFTFVLEKESCVTTFTQRLRDTPWGLQLEGITMPTPADKI